MYWNNLLLLLTAVLGASDFENPQPKGVSWELCGAAIDDIYKEGNGTTLGSCMSCSPTTDVCEPACQPLIDIFFEACDGTYTPPGLYYDPGKTIEGGWNEKGDEIRIAVFRCGCNGAKAIQQEAFAFVLVMFVTMFHLP